MTDVGMMCEASRLSGKNLMEKDPRHPTHDQPGDDYDDDYGCNVGWEPKDSVEGRRLNRVTKKEAFRCCGTLLQYRYDDEELCQGPSRPPSTERRPHDVAPPTECMQLDHNIESLTPFSCDKYWQTHWCKCMPCYTLDEEFEASVEDEGFEASADWRNRLEDEYTQYKAMAAETARRKRQADASRAKQTIAKLAAAVADDAGLAALSAWTESTGKRRLDHLKALCGTNHLMTSGCKAVLLARLTKCRLHGGPGPCPRCGSNKLEFEYPDHEIATMPSGVQCKHVKGFRRRCGWNRSIPEGGEPYPFIPMVEIAPEGGAAGPANSPKRKPAAEEVMGPPAKRKPRLERGVE